MRKSRTFRCATSIRILPQRLLLRQLIMDNTTAVRSRCWYQETCGVISHRYNDGLELLEYLAQLQILTGEQLPSPVITRLRYFKLRRIDRLYEHIFPWHYKHVFQSVARVTTCPEVGLPCFLSMFRTRRT